MDVETMQLCEHNIWANDSAILWVDGKKEEIINPIPLCARTMKPCQGYQLCPNYFPRLEKQTDDNVNHPNHYTQGGIECIKAIEASMTPKGFQDYCKGNVLKYVWRWRDKGGVEDLKKASVYLNWMIESAEEDGQLDDTKVE